LKLTNRKKWKCNKCFSSYNKAYSLYCKDCDFDVCKSCFLEEKKDKINHAKMNDYLENKNERKKPLIIEDNSQKKMNILIQRIYIINQFIIIVYVIKKD
jgi:hypothetical protein